MKRLLLPVVLAASILAGACSKPVVMPPGPAGPVVSTPSPATVAVTLPVETVTNAFQKSAISKGAMLPAFGLFFFNVTTGAGEGYTSPLLMESGITLVGGGRRWLQVSNEQRTYITDRTSGKAWGWDVAKMKVIASGGDLLLLALAEPNATRFVVADKELNPVSSFTGKAGDRQAYNSAVFSPDGKKLLLRAHDRTLHLVDTATGKDQELGLAGKERPKYFISPGEISLSPDGQEIRIVSNHFYETPTGSAIDRDIYFADIQRFAWTGKEAAPLLSVPGLNPKVSPDGTWVSYETMVDGKVLTAVIADSQTGKPQAWAYSASTCYQDGGAIGGRWTDQNRGVPLIAGAYWVHVKAESGEEGWIALKPEFLKWAPGKGLLPD